ncbi:hypothetical protein HanRHA438_Chr17g0816951 [Helianthus annuus]|nr:hypothetical protein HanRHA438_Chr17g0816951 [Helianthus annuus]
MKKQGETNAQTLADFHLLVKRLKYNVARLAKVDFHELKAPVPQEKPAGESETPQQQFKQTEASSTKKQKQPMGPSPSMPKLLMGPPTNIPNPDTTKLPMQGAVPVQSSSTALTGET